MRVLIRSVGTALIIVAAAVLLALTSTMTSVFTLAASTYIIGGTQFDAPFCLPFCGTLSTPQQNINLATPYINGTFGPPPGTITVLNYPASFWPISEGGLTAPTYNQGVAAGVAALPSPGSIQDGSVIFGYSQGAIVATTYKRNFNAYYSNPQNGTAPPITFVLLGNGSRPNGGAMERFNGVYIPGLDFSFIGATPTTTAGAPAGQITTYDIARQYDGFADFPTNPLNLLADANALMGVALVHPGYGTVDMSQAQFQATYGDTAYYLIPTYPLPLLMPLASSPIVGPIAADMLDPVLRVLVEAGYNRTINPGVPTPANFLYFPNPGTLGNSLLAASSLGLTLGLQDIMGTRQPGTPPPGLMGQNAYGIGGPPVTLPNQTPPVLPLAQTMATTSSVQSSATVSTAAANPVQVAATPSTTTQTPTPSTTNLSLPTKPPLLNSLRGPIGGSPSMPGVKNVASTVKGVVTNSLTAIAGALGAHPAGAAGATQAGTTSGGGTS